MGKSKEILWQYVHWTNWKGKFGMFNWSCCTKNENEMLSTQWDKESMYDIKNEKLNVFIWVSILDAELDMCSSWKRFT